MNNLDFNSCNVILDGEYATGLGAGNPISVAYREAERVKPYVGASGEVTSAKTNDYTANITITLAQDSSTNSLLSSYHNADKQFPIMFEDANVAGKIRASSNDCMVINYAEITRGNEVTERQWVIFVPNLKIDE